MTNGHIVRQSETDEPPQIVTFESYAIDLNRFEPKSDGGGFKPRERFSAIMPIPSRTIPITASAGAIPGRVS